MLLRGVSELGVDSNCAGKTIQTIHVQQRRDSQRSAVCFSCFIDFLHSLKIIEIIAKSPSGDILFCVTTTSAPAVC